MSGKFDSEDIEISNSQKGKNNIYLIYNQTISLLNNIKYIVQYNKIFYQIHKSMHNLFIAVSIYPLIDTSSFTLQYYRQNRLTTIPTVYLSQTNEEMRSFLYAFKMSHPLAARD